MAERRVEIRRLDPDFFDHVGIRRRGEAAIAAVVRRAVDRPFVPPTFPGADVSLDVRLTNPCATYGTSADELTPVTNRVNSTGMFENIGRLSTLRRSRFCPVASTPVSRSGPRR